MFNFNGMPYKRSGRAGGKSVSMIGMLVLLLAALLVLPSCFDDDDPVAMPDPSTVTDPDSVPARPDCDPALGEADNTWTGGDNGETVCGGGGEDTLKGMDGDDELYGDADDDRLYGGDGRDTLYGGEGDDTLDGGEDDDTLIGGPGDDTLIGGPGDDDMDGGADVDTASYASSESAVEVDLTSNDIRSSGDAARDSLTNIENLVGSKGNDSLTGNGGPNVIDGGAGNDDIDGGDGDDTLIGGAGDDTLDGGEGNDTASYANEATVAEDMDTGTKARAPSNVTVNIATGATSGKPAVFTVFFGEGTNQDDSDSIVAVTTKDKNDEDVHTSTIENLTGGEGNDVFTGDARVNVLKGGKGMDRLDGGLGDDVIYGGDGNDTIYGGNKTTSGDGSAGVEDGTDGADTINGGDGDDTIYGGSGDDTIDGGENGTDGDTINGEEGDDMIVADPSDSVDGGAHNVDKDGDSTIKPGEDGDTLDYGGYTVPGADETTTGVGSTGNALTLSDDGTIADGTPHNVEIVFGTKYHDTITDAASGVNIIIGREGNDVITGDGENGTLIGCAGSNTLIGSEGPDVYGVVKGKAPDVIMNFEVGTDEIHFKGWAQGEAANADVRAVATAGGSVLVNVGTTLVADVTADAATTPADLADAINDDGRTGCTAANESSCFDYSFPVPDMCVSP